MIRFIIGVTSIILTIILPVIECFFENTTFNSQTLQFEDSQLHFVDFLTSFRAIQRTCSTSCQTIASVNYLHNEFLPFEVSR